MLRKVMAAIMTNDRALVDQVSRWTTPFDSLDEAIKLYVTKLTRGSLDEHEDIGRWRSFPSPINLEHIGDIHRQESERTPRPRRSSAGSSSRRKARKSCRHSTSEPWIRCGSRSAVFMSGDVNEARKLLAEKAALRNTELAATERHLDRLREGRPRPSKPPRCISTCCATCAASLAHLLGSLSRARRRRRIAGPRQRRKRSGHAAAARRASLAAIAAGGR